MRINTNINSMRTQEYMRQNQTKMSNAMDRLSSGKRINNASDDAAGLAIATRMRARESGLNVAANNTQDGMSLIRTADSAMNSVSNILLRMRDIANQSANGTNTKDNQAALQKEFGELQKQITYIADNTQFNDKNLLNENSTVKIQTLDSSEAGQQIGIDLKATTLAALGIDKLTIGTATAPNVQTAIDAKDALDAATETATATRAKILADGATASTPAELAKNYIEAKEAQAEAVKADPTDASKDAAVGAALRALDDDAKKLVEDYENKLHDASLKKAAYTKAFNAASADVPAGSPVGTRSEQAIISAYENAKDAIFAGATSADKTAAKNYIVAKANFEKDPSTKAEFEIAKNALESNAGDAKTLVTAYENAKATTSAGTPLDAVSKIDAALKTVADNRATLGATLNRLDFNVNNLKSQSASMASAASQIEDADMAKEMSEMTKFKILNEAGISMLSQANQTPQMVSKLLQ
ncbi:flagellin N-terminal helical domain-containing protein [Bacillus paranthracis]|uniref:flagellin N-terminal helical domain-containing protein n=1 Tax=Bacillus paranthracis TaxID=2026186 RepID=UPI000A3B3F8D|nr:flagellin [Bacillus paranthracis]MCC2497814.1 flagellin [Bacillus paranthracis]MDF9578814.1 flagellin [Bacillus paranthracis]MDG1615319.1 flagellin [Bacillus paranthracis]OUA68931.1 flagellin [Bacillus thuringiensis serovar thailandensis]